MFREVDEMPKCVCCGIVMPVDEIVFEHHGRKLYACSQKCIRIYDTYKFPRYRDEILAVEAEALPPVTRGYAPEELV